MLTPHCLTSIIKCQRLMASLINDPLHTGTKSDMGSFYNKNLGTREIGQISLIRNIRIPKNLLRLIKNLSSRAR